MGLFSNWFKRKHIEDIVDSYTDANGNTDLIGAYGSIKRRGYDSEEDKMFVAGFAAAQKYAALQMQKEQDRPVIEVTTTMREVDVDVDVDCDYDDDDCIHIHAGNRLYDFDFNQYDYKRTKDELEDEEWYDEDEEFEFCDVKFPDSEHTFTYIVPDDLTLLEDDKVVARAGIDAELKVGEIWSIYKSSKRMTRIPMYRMREIISEYDEEEDSYLLDDEYEDDEYENDEYEYGEDDEYEYEEDEDFYEEDEV